MKKRIKPQPTIKTWGALAKALGVVPSTVATWRKMEGAPEGKDLEQWKIFQRNREASSRQGSGRQIVDGGKYTKEQIIDLRAQLTEEQVINQQLKNQLAKFEIDKQERGLVPIEEAQATIREALGPIISRLKSMSRSLSSRANPTDPQLAEMVISDAVNGILRQAQSILTNGKRS